MAGEHRVRFCFLGVLCAVIALAGTVIPSSGRALSVVSVPASIDATGRTDVSAKMAAFFASVPDGSVVLFPPHAYYQMNWTFVLWRRHNLTIEGSGATFFAQTPGDAHRSNVRLIESSDILIRDLVVKGANPHAGTSLAAYVPAKEHQHGFELLGVDHVTLDHVGAFNTYGDFVYLAERRSGWSDHVTIKNSVFARNGRQGIALIGARNVVIEHNLITDVRRATFDFEPDGAGSGVENVVIRDNAIGAGRLLFVAAAGRQPVNHVEIIHNHLYHQSLQMAIRNPNHHYRDDWKIIDNTSDFPVGNPLGAAMRIRNVDGLEIAGNVQRFQKGRWMVLAEIHASCHVSVHDNFLPGSVGTIRTYTLCRGAGLITSPAS